MHPFPRCFVAGFASLIFFSSCGRTSEQLLVTGVGSGAILLEWRWTEHFDDPLDARGEGQLGEAGATSFSLSVASGVWDSGALGGVWPGRTDAPLPGTAINMRWPICDDNNGRVCLRRLRNALGSDDFVDHLGTRVQALWGRAIRTLSGLTCQPLGSIADETRDEAFRRGWSGSFTAPNPSGSLLCFSTLSSPSCTSAVHLPRAGLCSETIKAMILRWLPCGRWGGIGSFFSVNAVLGSPWHAVTLDIDRLDSAGNACTESPLGCSGGLRIRRSVLVALRLPSDCNRSTCTCNLSPTALLGSLRMTGSINSSCHALVETSAAATLQFCGCPNIDKDSCVHITAVDPLPSAIIMEPGLIRPTSTSSVKQINADGSYQVGATGISSPFLIVERLLALNGGDLSLSGGSVVTRLLLDCSANVAPCDGNSFIVVTVLPWFMVPTLTEGTAFTLHCAKGNSSQISWHRVANGWANEESLQGIHRQDSGVTPRVFAHRVDLSGAVLSSCDKALVSFSIPYVSILLHADECPPDTHRGLDIPAGLVLALVPHVRNSSGRDFTRALGRHAAPEEVQLIDVISTHLWQSSSIRSHGDATRYSWEGSFESASTTRVVTNSPRISFSLLASFQSQPLVIEPLCPDFAMPYNVMVLGMTVSAFVLGAIFNASARRPKQRAAVPSLNRRAIVA